MATKANFTSLYNGVGKTSLIVLMARQLQSEGYHILIVDNSYKVSRLPSMFGIPRVDRSLNEVMPLMKMENFTYQVLDTYINSIDDSIDVIGCSRKDIMDPVTMENMIKLIDFYGDYDYIFVESPVRYRFKEIPNIFVVDGRLPDYKQLVGEGLVAVINKYDTYSGMSLKKLGRDLLVFPYEPTMVSYELMGKYKFSDEFYDSLEQLLGLVDELGGSGKQSSTELEEDDVYEEEYEEEEEYEDPVRKPKKQVATKLSLPNRKKGKVK